MKTWNKTRAITFIDALKAAFPATIPVLTGFLVLGIAYGVLMQTKGYGVGWSVLMSAVAFCGSMQFVAITLLTTTFDPFAAFLMSLAVNARHLFYGISMLDTYQGMGKIRGFLIYTLCDETFSVVSGVKPPKGIHPPDYYLCISGLHYIYWVFGTLCGGLLGAVVSFQTKGLDFVLTALFVVLFLEQMIAKENRISGIIGLTCTVVGLVLFGADSMVIPSMILILVVLLIGRKKRCV